MPRGPADLPDSINRRDVARRLALLGLGGATSLGLGALWMRALSGKAPSDAAGFTEVRHQLGWIKGVQFGGAFMADALGFFEKERISARLIAGGPGTDYRTLVSSGRMLISESNVNGMIDSAVQGQPIVAFAAVMQRDPSAFLSLPERPVRTLEDMVGKTIGLPNSIRGQLNELLRRQRIDPSSVTFVPVGTDARMLLSGQVDAFYSWATTAAPGLRLANVEPHILHMSDVGAPGYGGLLFTRKDHLERRFELFVRYTRALIGGWTYLVDNPAETARTVVNNYAAAGADIREQTAQAQMMTSYIKTGDSLTSGLLWVKPDFFEITLRLARDAGTLPRGIRVNAEDLIDQRVIKAAHGL